MRNGGQIVVDQLALHGAELAFCVPGESFLPVLDAYRDHPELRLVVARHEAGASNMAVAAGKLTGRPGVALVSRAPGATHASTGVFTAFQDSTPMVLLVGQVPLADRGREALQELDYERFFGAMAKSVVEVGAPDELPEAIAAAFATAASGRPGPAVVVLPEDMLYATADVADAAPRPVEPLAPDAHDLARLRELLAGAERPLVVVGGGGWTAAAGRQLAAWAEASSLPLLTSFRRQDYVDNRSPSYAGSLTVGLDPALVQRVRESDLILALGTRLGDIATLGYTLIDIPRPAQTLIHVHADRGELGRVYETDLAIAAAASELVARLEPLDGARWAAWTESAHADAVADRAGVREAGEHVDMTQVAAFLSERLGEDGIVCQGAGNFTSFVHRFYEFREYGTLLAPCSGSMGFGLPAAVAAKALHPGRTVVCVAGDGDFLMSGHELSTAVQEQLPIVVLVVSNGMYGTIRMHQEREFPGRVAGTAIAPADFAALARGYGAYGATVERPEEFEPAFEAALQAGRPAVLDLRVDPDATTARLRLSALASA